MTVAVGLDDGHHLGAARPAAQLGGVGPDGVEIDDQARGTDPGGATGLTGGATVYLCLFADTTCVASPFSQVGVSSSTSPNFAFATVPPGAYKVVVRKGGNNSPDTPVNVDALTGAMVEAPLSIPAPVPPTP